MDIELVCDGHLKLALGSGGEGQKIEVRLDIG